MHISHTIDITAPQARVWDAVADVERCPEFASQFKTIARTDEGPLALGKAARVTPHGFWGAVWTVTEFEAPRSFTWEADKLPAVHLIAGQVVEVDGARLRITLSLRSAGPMATLLAPVLGRIFCRNVRQEAEGTRAYCEGGRL